MSDDFRVARSLAAPVLAVFVALGLLSIADTFQAEAFTILTPELAGALGISAGAIGGATNRLPKLTGPSWKVEKSTFDASSWSVTVTVCAGAVAAGLFSKKIE